MAHWPKTVRGNLYAVVLTIGAIALLVQAAVALSGPVIWTLVAVICGGSTVLYLWNRRMVSVSDRAAADAPSFGDVLALRRANEALELRS